MGTDKASCVIGRVTYSSNVRDAWGIPEVGKVSWKCWKAFSKVVPVVRRALI